MRRTPTIALCVLALSSAARAQTDDEKLTARSLGQEGQEALDKGDGKTAEDRFHRAVQIFDGAHANVPPTLLLGYARGAAKTSHFIAAEEAYNRIIRAGLPPGAPAPFVRALEDAKKEIDAVAPRVARVTINVTGCDNPSVTLDGAAIPSAVLGIKKAVDPGTHEVKASAAGCVSQTASFTVGDGKEATSALTLQKEAVAVSPTSNPNPTPTPNPNPNPNPNPTPNPPETSSGGGSGLRIAGFTTLGVGGAALVMGFITGGLAIGKHSDLAKECDANGNCPSTASSTLSDYHTLGALSTVGFIAGGVALAAGLTMVLLAPSSKKSERAFITPYVGFGSVGAFGRF
jgi:hypothetical protein